MCYLGEYESIDDYASVNDTAAADCVMPMTSDNDVIDTVYLAVHSYTKRKSGEVNLQQGSTVDVLQTELSGSLMFVSHIILLSQITLKVICKGISPNL